MVLVEDIHSHTAIGREDGTEQDLDGGAADALPAMFPQTKIWRMEPLNLTEDYAGASPSPLNGERIPRISSRIEPLNPRKDGAAASPSPLNGERAGVRGENILQLNYFHASPARARHCEVHGEEAVIVTGSRRFMESPHDLQTRPGTMNPGRRSSLSSSGGEGRGEEAVIVPGSRRFMERGCSMV
jgi:hypothetical protein